VAGGDNLTIQIGGDSSKLRADLKFTQQALKDLDRQISAAFKSGDTARARELSNTFGKMKDEAVALDRSLKGLGATGSQAFNDISRSAVRADASVNVTARSATRLFKQLQSLPRGLGIGGTLLGGGIGGAVGAGIGIGISKLIDQFEELAKSMREIRDISRETTAKPLAVQGMQELAAEAAESAETANKFLSGVAGTIQAVATKTPDLTKNLSRNFASFGSQAVEVMRGSEQATRDFSDALAILQVDENNLRKLPFDQQVKVLGEAFQRAEKNAKQLHLSQIQLNEISKSVFKVPAETADKLITAYTKLNAKTNELAASQRGATKESFDQLDGLTKAQAKLSQQATESSAAIAKNTVPARTALTLGLSDFIANLPLTLMQVLTAGAPSAFSGAGPDFGGGGELGVPEGVGAIKKEAATLPAVFETVGKAIGTVWKNTFSPSGMGDPSIPAMPVEATKTQFDTLPAYFKGLADQIKGIWADLMKSLAAQNAAAADATKRIQIEPLSGQAAPVSGAAGSAGGLPTVLRGTGRGPDDGHGPVVGGAGSGYGPQRETQSTTPGLGDYQAPLPRVVYPAATSTYGSQAAKSAAEASADAAAASRTAAEASRSAAQAWTDPSYNYASGGMVRGAGSGTSDSILARVSNGEFVMRAAAVNRLGASFLSRLNGFADGGMVMPSRSIPSFAGGGLVGEAYGGRPVHLHLGGHSFALSGNSSVVDSLVSEAHRQRMRSAGTKPSWYGGR
jgi:hypothetical protein